MNQGVQFPIARSFVNIEAANLMRYKAAELFDANEACEQRQIWLKCWHPRALWEAATIVSRLSGDLDLLLSMG